MARPDDRTVLLNGYRDGVELGVVGAGRMGLAAAPVFAAAGFEVALSSRRGPERLAAVVSVRWMVAWLQQRGLALFGYYRIALGALVAALLSSGRLAP